MPTVEGSQHAEWLGQETLRLLRFGRASACGAAGFAWLDSQGRPQLDAPFDLWVTCRMTHVYALGTLLGYDWCGPLADHGIAALCGPFNDPAHGGWYSQVGADGVATDPTKAAYAHAQVVLAAASAAAAGRPHAADVLRRALGNQNVHFRDGVDGMVIDVFNREFTRSDDYRGASANLRTVEAYMAAADLTGDSRWRQRALAITERLIDQADQHDWVVPEHYTTDWRPLADYNADQPDDQFRPYGWVPGHGFEWSRLVLQLWAGLGQAAPGWMKPAAESLFRRAYLDAWQEEPVPGFILTADWSGRPIIQTRLHWVAAEAVAAAATAYRATLDPLYHHLYARWWELIEERFVDQADGSWHHELSPNGQPSNDLWEGKPDIYHAVQATLIPRLPLAPSLASALRAGLLDSLAPLL
ncbi:MAG: AGE family epimerase/isomerase [Bifidobacteriaceae bacterium]|jgi:mannose/cellobiose epimerase-like protein (N-acyl-D-glucosamine 2-epimerase family)|nr:AGE family epimerase/isomerase [Bifidobacteriaceae bacterium]